MRNKHAQRGTGAQCVGEDILNSAMRAMARYGFLAWRVDLKGDAYSVYNITLRNIFLLAFQVAVSCYGFPNVSPAYASPKHYQRLILFFDHLIFSKYKKKWKTERNKPGTHAQKSASVAAVKRKERLRDHRVDYLTRNGAPARVIAAVKPLAAHSDDESSPGRTRWIVHDKPERSIPCRTFFRQLDCASDREKVARGRSAKIVPRVLPANPLPPVNRQIPIDMPLDYFSPEFYNSAGPANRQRFSSGYRAFPPDVNSLFDASLDQTAAQMKHTEFQETYGPELHQLYILPGQELKAHRHEQGVLERFIVADEDSLDSDTDMEYVDPAIQRAAYNNLFGYAADDESDSGSESE